MGRPSKCCGEDVARHRAPGIGAAEEGLEPAEQLALARAWIGRIEIRLDLQAADHAHG